MLATINGFLYYYSSVSYLVSCLQTDPYGTVLNCYKLLKDWYYLVGTNFSEVKRWFICLGMRKSGRKK